MRKLFYWIGAVLLIVALAQCKSPQLIDNESSINEDAFFNDPFGFEVNDMAQFREQFPKAKETYVIKRNQHYPEKADTIYKFSKGNSEVFYYSSFSGKSFLLAANIKDQAFPLQNNVQPGMTRALLCHYIKGLPCTGESPYTKKARSAEFKLFFNEKSKLERIFFQFYPD